MKTLIVWAMVINFGHYYNDSAVVIHNYPTKLACFEAAKEIKQANVYCIPEVRQ